MIGSDSLPAIGIQDLLVARLHGSDGSLAWAVNHGGSNAYVSPLKIVTDGMRVFVSGSYSGRVNLGGSELESSGDPPPDDPFVVAYNATDGSHLWSEHIGDSAGVVTTMAATSTKLAIGIGFNDQITLGSLTLMGKGISQAIVRIDPGTGIYGSEITSFNGLAASSKVSARLLYTDDHLAGVATFSGSVMLGSSPPELTSAGGEDVAVFRIGF
jgi:hypothetical protein